MPSWRRLGSAAALPMGGSLRYALSGVDDTTQQHVHDILKHKGNETKKRTKTLSGCFLEPRFIRGPIYLYLLREHYSLSFRVLISVFSLFMDSAV